MAGHSKWANIQHRKNKQDAKSALDNYLGKIKNFSGYVSYGFYQESIQDAEDMFKELSL